jgi:hypothetical protein
MKLKNKTKKKAKSDAGKKVAIKLTRSAVKKITKRPGWEVSEKLKNIIIFTDGSVEVKMKKEK